MSENKSKNVEFNRIILPVLFAFVFFLCIASPVFAGSDSLESDPAKNGEKVFSEYQPENYANDFIIDTYIKQTADIIYENSGEGTKANPTYDTTDIYNLLNTCLYGVGTNSSGPNLRYIGRVLASIKDSLNGNNGFASQNNSTLYDYIKAIVAPSDTTAWPYTTNPIVFMARAMEEIQYDIFAGDLNYSSYSFKDLMLMCTTEILDINGNTATTNALLSSVYTATSGSNAHATSIDNKLTNTNNKLDSIDSTTSNIYTLLNNNKVKWLTSGTYQGVSLDGLTLENGNNNILNQDTLYFHYNNLNLGDNYLYKITLPLGSPTISNALSVSDIEFYFLYNNTLYPIKNVQYILNQGRTYSDVFIKGYLFSTAQLVVKISGDNLGYYQNAQSVSGFWYIDTNDKDYYNIAQIFNSDEIAKQLSLYMSIYASPDLIQAKQEQQEYEDSVIDDFTGNGAAASKKADTKSAKNISSTIRNGLDMGGSANDALSVFNSGSSLWQFFTTTTSQNLNTVSNSRNTDNVSNTRSSSSYTMDMEVIDFLTQRDLEYYNSINSTYNENDYR